jgi:fructokinase
MSQDLNRLDVLSFGEALVDFLPDSRGVPLRRVENFRRVVGGAPANLTVGLSRLGCQAGLHGKVGDDEFGQFLCDQLQWEGVETRGVTKTDDEPTGITFVSLDADGERSFVFYRHPSADMMFRIDDVDPTLIEHARIFQYGSNLLVSEALRDATLEAVHTASDTGCFMSMDPNLRLHMWSDDQKARRWTLDALQHTDLLKVNQEELDFLAPDSTLEEAWSDLFAPRDIGVVILTQAGDGASLITHDGRRDVDAPAQDEIVDTTGAGDGFMSGLLAGITHRLDDDESAFASLDWPLSTWRDILELGCYVGSSVCTELGATPALPHYETLPDGLL